MLHTQDMMSITENSSSYRNMGPLRAEWPSRIMKDLLGRHDYVGATEFVGRGSTDSAEWFNNLPKHGDNHDARTVEGGWLPKRWNWLKALVRPVLDAQQLDLDEYREDFVKALADDQRIADECQGVACENLPGNVMCRYGCPEYLAADTLQEALDEYTRYHNRMMDRKVPMRTLMYVLSQEAGSGWGNHVQDMSLAFFIAFATRRAFLVDFDHPGDIASLLGKPGIRLELYTRL